MYCNYENHFPADIWIESIKHPLNKFFRIKIGAVLKKADPGFLQKWCFFLGEGLGLLWDIVYLLLHVPSSPRLRTRMERRACSLCSGRGTVCSCQHSRQVWPMVGTAETWTSLVHTDHTARCVVPFSSPCICPTDFLHWGKSSWCWGLIILKGSGRDESRKQTQLRPGLSSRRRETRLKYLPWAAKQIYVMSSLLGSWKLHTGQTGNVLDSPSHGRILLLRWILWFQRKLRIVQSFKIMVTNWAELNYSLLRRQIFMLTSYCKTTLSS